MDLRTAGGHTILPSRLTLDEVAGLRDHLMTALGTKIPVSLDGSAVEDIDTAGLQVLVALCGREDGAFLGWLAVSERLAAAASLIGVQQLLRLPDAAHAR